MKLNLGLDRILVGGKRPALHQDLVAIWRRAVKRHHHQVKVAGYVFEVRRGDLVVAHHGLAIRSNRHRYMELAQGLQPGIRCSRIRFPQLRIQGLIVWLQVAPETHESFLREVVIGLRGLPNNVLLIRYGLRKGYRRKQQTADQR